MLTNIVDLGLIQSGSMIKSHASRLLSESEQMTDNALLFTKKNVDECHPRLAGSPGCKRCADQIKSEFDTICDSSVMERFDFSLGAFIGFMKVISIGYLIIVVCGLLGNFWLYPASILYIICWFSGWGEFVLYKEYFDRFYPKRTGYNVIGKIEPQLSVVQQIIIGGHHDSTSLLILF